MRHAWFLARAGARGTGSGKEKVRAMDRSEH
jgi:hypothetical protein